MDMLKTIKLSFIAVLGLALSSVVWSQTFEEGVHYRALSNPLNVSIPDGKVGLIQEFFWYGCIHCYNLDPAVVQFKEQMPDSLAFEEVPATFSEIHELHARLFYAWQFLGMPEQTHQAIYDEVFVSNNNLRNERAVVQFMTQQGADADELQRMMNSFTVQTKVRAAQNLTAGAQVRGTPSVLVNGRYMVEAGLPGVQTNRDMLRIAGQLALEKANSR
jgi:thiol:disulfide interchange protein DsbA